eukprot:1362223-Amorphochlora_amoeboformis.AAC.1
MDMRGRALSHQDSEAQRMFIQLSSMLEDKNSGFLGTMGATNGSFGFPLQPIDTKTTCNQQRNHPGARPGLASENTLPPKLKKKLQGPKKVVRVLLPEL